jgi:cytochrome c
LPYDYEDDNEGYASAKANLANPVPLTQAHLENGQALYGIYCAICHGNKGNGLGYLVETEKILGVPSYDAREITAGSIYHVMYYGINYMGSYASQTSIEERWEISHYVEALRADLMGVERKPLVDINTPATAMTPTDMEMTSESNDSEVTEQYPPQPNDIKKMTQKEKETSSLNTTKNNGQ